MSFVDAPRAQASWVRSPSHVSGATPLLARMALLSVIVAACVGGMLATDSSATARVIGGAGGDWANLLRAMALLKGLFAGAATAVVMWRLGAPISMTRWAGYAFATGVMWAGPGLIWGLAHIAFGALLLHGGLIATALFVWRDPATHARLSRSLAAAVRRPRRVGASTAGPVRPSSKS